MCQVLAYTDNFDFFQPNFPEKGIFSLKKKKSISHLIQYIRNSLGAKFQLKSSILNFWTKFKTKVYFQSKTEKANITFEFNIFNLNIFNLDYSK